MCQCSSNELRKLLDIMLPDMSGFRLTESLRRISPDVPIIIVTAKQSPSDKHYGFMVGADDYMTKPVDEEEPVDELGEFDPTRTFRGNSGSKTANSK